MGFSHNLCYCRARRRMEEDAPNCQPVQTCPWAHRDHVRQARYCDAHSFVGTGSNQWGDISIKKEVLK